MNELVLKQLNLNTHLLGYWRFYTKLCLEVKTILSWIQKIIDRLSKICYLFLII